ncbi:MAG: hypothetical protein CVU65_10085 [Deltaproteobacteria bacterium HGW-Deltaproteobacteria-22]|jgi:uncharacterized phage infection (PIP) family protein YhgE|nr:MAG: hypothetical protein CVU65_10085 [Deltaproteobacteria bacterium HGW-Deltaproteobacteria-22]
MKRITCPFTGKVWAWIALILLTVAAVAGVVVLSVKIHSGEQQLAAGQKKLEKGQRRVERGNRRLKEGKQELSEGKAEYAQAEDGLFSEFFDDILDDGEGFATARDEIAAGEKKVAGGQKRVHAGKQRLAAGRQRFERESRHLVLAGYARIFCAVLAAFLVALSIFMRFFRK